MIARGMVVRFLEWRAGKFEDPAERLQFLRRSMAPHDPAKRNLKLRWAPVVIIAVAAVAMMQADGRRAVARVAKRTASSGNAGVPQAAPALGHVWLVEASQESELYSNGLRINNQYLAETQPRSYLAFARQRMDSGESQRRAEPVGIVFHTTESHLAPFEESHTKTLRRDGEGLLEYVRRNRSYHFVIDRFGQVFRVVRESDYANHAGHSVWADKDWVYVNLNQSFFGVAFEAQSRGEEDDLPANPAQLHAARVLTDMLRARYGIAAGNCVAHAQVSVNPANQRAGYHTDWAAKLPFRELGLEDNYRQPLASVLLFGFGVDSLLIQAGGEPLGQGVQSAEDLVGKEAANRGMPLERYREVLRKRYKDAIVALRAKGVPGENN
jgi:N-acetylmuramoyl-L-alanine amidase